MAILDVDTKKMRDSGKDIMKIVSSLNEQFDGLFSRISHMATSTHEWVGVSANEFIRLAKIDKAHYTQFNNEIFKMGKMLVDQSYYLEEDIKKIRG